MTIRNRRPQWLLQNRTTDLAVADATDWAMITDGDFTVDVWGNFDGATVNLYITAPDGSMILLNTYLEPTCEYGKIGVVSRRFKAELVGAGAATNVNMTLTE